MPDRPYRGRIDHARLGRYLRVLSVPTRILLLQKLQVPQLASEIRLPPFRQDQRFDTARSISRQAVEEHLAKLEEVGLVRTRKVRQGGRALDLWHVDQARLFTVVDELRRLALLRTAPDTLTVVTAGARTGTGPAPSDPTMPPGRALVLASGPSEGAPFALQGSGPWTIGRHGAGAMVPVPHDPYVSAANAILSVERGGLVLRDSGTSRNGTTHNWRLLERGEAVTLIGGDTIGVGRSLLLYREGRA